MEIVEVSPRDGLQNESVLLPTPAKIELIERVIAAGARRVEATSFVHPERVPQMADADEVMAAVPRRSDVSYIGLALNERGVERGLRAACDELNLVVLASETFNQRNQGASTPETLQMVERAASRIRREGRRVTVTVGAAFGCPFEGEVPVDQVVTVARQAAECGIDELALADTIGVAVPGDVRARVRAVRDATGDAPLRLHLHDTRHTGIANAQAAVDAGVPTLDASLGGIGGCPFAPGATGNIATEDLVYLLDRSGIPHGWSAKALGEHVPWLEEQLDKPVPGLAAKVAAFP